MENVWVFGNNAGLDFNAAGQPVPIRSNNIFSTEACASICDENGQLLFYTEGSSVWDRNGNLMNNGTDLTPVVPINVSSPTYSTSQGALIIPFINDRRKYFIFSLIQYDQIDFGKLYFSVVDMSLNNGNGDVTAKGVFIDSNLIEQMTAVVGDRCNIWLLVGSRKPEDEHEIKAYEITEAGINRNPVVSPGFPTYNFPTYFAGQFAVAPDRKRIALTKTRVAVPENGLALFEFNPTTGRASNYQQLAPGDGGYGVCFSPDGEKLYFSSSSSGICQYDLSSNDIHQIRSSKIQLNNSADPLKSLKIGPDNKIYFRGSSYGSLSRINYPDRIGSACFLEEDVISLVQGTSIYLGLPHIVPILVRDTLYTSQSIIADCFANANRLNIHAVNDTSGWDYVWNTGVTGAVIIADTPGVYIVSYHTAPCVYHVDTFHVSFPNGVLPTITTMAECRSDSNGSAYASTYPGDPVEYTYTWIRAADTLAVGDTLTGVSSGVYSLHVQTSTGCDTLLFFDIPEEDFRVSFEVSDTLICLGDVIELTNSSDTHFVRYHWAFDNGDTLVVQTPLPYAYPESGAYRLMLAGEGAVCKDTTYQTILVDQPILPDFKIEPEAVCVGQPVHFFPATDSTTVQLIWDMEEQLRIDPQVQPGYQHSFSSSGSFPVTLNIQSRACPDTSVTDSLRVYPYPEVDLGADSSICLHGQPVYLKNLREAPLSPYHQVWSTGDTTEVLKVVQPGVYTLSLTAEPMGCTTTESIEISKDCYIDIPNAFTPDGDGHNDYFLPRQLLSEGLTRFHMQVFNRWGQLLYETNRVDGRGWDGQFNGKAQPSGVYLYRIEAGFINGLQESYEGNVTLLR